jgi:ABC-type sugar transport system ATPase subunit
MAPNTPDRPTAGGSTSDGAAATLAPTLVADRIVKRFGRVEALRGASLEAREGKVTAIIGDNGAGKSTLIKCLAGIHQPDEGRIVLRGEDVTFANPQVARDAGMEVVYQDLALVDSLPVWKNLFLNRERRKRGLLDRRAMREQAREMLERLDVGLPSVDEESGNLSGGQRQAVAIARAAGWGSGVVIMDEPTAALGVREGRAVEELILRLRDEGRCLLVISHNFEQVMRISDHVYVMRQGRVVQDVATADTTGLELVSYITGAHLLDGPDDERSDDEPSEER